MAENTEQDKDVIRRAAFGAVALVSKADPGFFATFKESAAGSKVLASAPENIRNILKGGLVAPPTGSSMEEVEQKVLADLQTSVQQLSANPADAAGYRDVITAAVEAVAAASKGVAPAEQAVIDKIKAALAGGGQAPAPAPTDGQAPAPSAPAPTPSAPAPSAPAPTPTPTPQAPSASVPPVPGPPPTPGTPPVPSPPPTPGPPSPPVPPTEPVPPTPAS